MRYATLMTMNMMEQRANTEGIRPASSHEGEFHVTIASAIPDIDQERRHITNELLPELRVWMRHGSMRDLLLNVEWAAIPMSPESPPADFIKPGSGHPVLLGLLGDGVESPLAVTGMNAAYPWLAEVARRRSPLPMIELLERMLDDPLIQGRIFLYKRVSTAGHGSRSPQAERDALRSLERRVAELRIPIRKFHDAESLGAMIRSDMLTLLERYSRTPGGLPSIERERLHHTDRGKALREGYVPRVSFQQKLTRYADGYDGHGVPLMLAGPSGSGKTTLLANWIANYAEARDDVTVITYYIDEGPAARDAAGIIRYIMAEIKRCLAIPDDLPSSPKEMIAAFPDWLNHAREGRRLVLAIDGLESLDAEAADLDWLPRKIPSDVRLIVSITDAPENSSMLKELRKRSCKEIALAPLTHNERRAVIARLLDRSSITISAAERDRLADKPMSGHAFSLWMGLAQMATMGSHEQREELITYLLSTSSPEDVMRHVLERIEQTHGKPSVQRVLSLIWASRRGLSDMELETIAHIDNATLRHIILALDHLLMRRGNMLGFVHRHVRAAIEDRYELRNGAARRLHRELALHFQGEQISPRRTDEEPWQWRQACAWSRLEGCITDIPMVVSFHELDRQHELLGYWTAMRGRARMAARYEESLRRHLATLHPAATDAADLCIMLGALMDAAAHHEAALDMYRQARSLIRGIRGQAEKRSVVAKYQGEALRSLARYGEAGAAYREVLAFLKSGTTERSKEMAEIHERIATLDYSLKRFAVAERSIRRALTIHESLGVSNQPVVFAPLSLLAAIAQQQGRKQEASRILQHVLLLCEQRYGPDHPYTGAALNNVATTLMREERFAEAHDRLRRAIDIDKRSYGPDHPETANKRINLGQCLKKLGYAKRAEKVYTEALRQLEKLRGPRHPDVADCINNIAALYRSMKNYDLADTYYQRALGIRMETYGLKNPATINVMLNIASLRALQGAPDEAIRLYRTAIRQKIRVSGPKHPETLRTIGNFHDLLRRQGWPEKRWPFRDVVEP